jgi:type II secretory pathway predicted ATPase ExeA
LTGIYRELLRRLGQVPSFFKPHLVSQVRSALEELTHRERQPVILCDESDRLTDPWLEDMRMLLSRDMDSGSLATLILVGHTSLSSRLRMVNHEALWSRINFRYQLKPLDLQGTAEYIHHHVRAAGHRGNALFSDGFISKAFEYTRGLPRRINQLCTYSLIAAAARSTNIIDEAIFQQAQSDLDEDL